MKVSGHLRAQPAMECGSGAAAIFRASASEGSSRATALVAVPQAKAVAALPQSKARTFGPGARAALKGGPIADAETRTGAPFSCWRA